MGRIGQIGEDRGVKAVPLLQADLVQADVCHHPLRVEKILGQLQGCLESWNRERTLQDVLAELPASGSAQMTS